MARSTPTATSAAASSTEPSTPAPARSVAPYSFAIDLNIHGASFKRGDDVPVKSSSHPWCTEAWCKEAAEFGHVVRNQAA